jgi:hypothetical protein
MKFNLETKKILYVIVAIFALYGLIVLIRKIFNRESNNPKKEWGYYLNEQFRYTKYSDEIEKDFANLAKGIIEMIDKYLRDISDIMSRLTLSNVNQEKDGFIRYQLMANGYLEKAIDNYNKVIKRASDINPTMQKQIKDKMSFLKKAKDTLGNKFKELSNLKKVPKTFSKIELKTVKCPETNRWFDDGEYIKGKLKKDSDLLNCTYIPL